MTAITGIDVSGHQSETYSLTGAEFVFVKATQSTNYINPSHAAQVQRARAGGRVVGHYHFLVKGNIPAQAAYFVQHAAPAAGDLLACDWETNPADGATPTSAEKDTFIRAVKALKPAARVLLYCSQSVWTGRDTTSYAGDGLWVAQYNGKPGQPDITAPWVIHQYTSTPLDTNVAAFSSRTAMAAWAAGNEDPVATLDADDKKYLTALVGGVPAAVWNHTESSPTAPEGTNAARRAGDLLRYGDAHYAVLTAQLGAVTGLVTALTTAVQAGGGLTVEQATAAATAGAEAALAQLGHALTN